jgi:predicted PurR-regulated permease PerM
VDAPPATRPPAPPTRLEQGVAAVLLILLAAGCLIVLLPFVAAILWSAILAFATWPIFIGVCARFGLGRTGGATAMVIAAMLVLLAPMVLIVADFADDARQLVDTLRDFFAAGLPDPPEWVAGLPIVGATVASEWRRISGDAGELQALLAPYAQMAARWGVNFGLTLAQGVLDLAIALFVAFFLWRDGETFARRIQGGLVRLAGARGERLLGVAAQSVRAVVYGVLGTAIIQGAIVLIGLAVARVPNALLLGFLAVLAAPIPLLGPALVWGPVALWLAGTEQWSGLIAVGVAGLIASVADNFIRPVLIARGGSTIPIALVLLGIIGGLVAFGFLGLFLGPTLLAVGFTLLAEWTQPEDRAAP